MTDNVDQSIWTERLKILADVDLLTLDSLDHIGDTLKQIVEIGNRLVPSDKGISIILWNHETERFTLSATSVENLSPPDLLRDTRSDNGATRWIVETVKPLVVRNVKDDPFRKGRRMKDYGVRSYIGVPIQFSKKAIGVLFVFNAQAKDYSNDELLFCELLANRAATAIKNASYVLELKDRAMRDGLTGLINRVTFFEIAEKVCQSNIRNNQAISIMFVDVDNFKQINDLYGHHTGDRVLQLISQVITGSIREMDIAARYGGDEFVVLFPQADEADVQEIRKRLLHKLSASEIMLGSGGISVSIGQATSLSSCDIETLVKKADLDMYEVKKSKNPSKYKDKRSIPPGEYSC